MHAHIYACGSFDGYIIVGQVANKRVIRSDFPFAHYNYSLADTLGNNLVVLSEM